MEETFAAERTSSVDATDETLAERAQHGDENALTGLLQRYEHRLRRFAASIVGASDADDVLQEAMLRIYQNLRSFHADRKFSPWAYRIVRNEAISHLRRQRRHPWLDIEADTIMPKLFSKEPGSDEQVDRALLAAQVRQHLDALDRKSREVLELRFLDEFSYEEMSVILEIPVSTVGVRLNRAKARLRTLLTPPS